MAVINLIPLLCGPRLSMVTKLLGISLRTSLASHRWIGRTAIALAAFHIAISTKDGDRFSRTWGSVFGVVAGSAFGLIFILSIRPVIRRVYEWFLNSHLLLAAMAILAIWRHLPSKTAAAKFLNIGMCQWAIISAVHWGLFARRNFVFGRPFATVVVTPLSPAKPVLDTPASEAYPTLLQ
ncbi:hypothetical protein ACLOAV_005907 [Pseudogymnoascus australis]